MIMKISLMNGKETILGPSLPRKEPKLVESEGVLPAPAPAWGRVASVTAKVVAMVVLGILLCWLYCYMNGMLNAVMIDLEK